MTTDRSYRKAMTIDQALTQIETCAGTQFDPTVAAALIRVASDSHRHETKRHLALTRLPA
jgi:HD-GYP domain-containing protein (c-di-GMP phosphodiesterase class II)